MGLRCQQVLSTSVRSHEPLQIFILTCNGRFVVCSVVCSERLLDHLSEMQTLTPQIQKHHSQSAALTVLDDLLLSPMSSCVCEILYYKFVSQWGFYTAKFIVNEKSTNEIAQNTKD